MELQGIFHIGDKEYKEALINACGDYLIDPEYETLTECIYDRLEIEIGDIELPQDTLIKVVKDAKRYAIELLISTDDIS